MCIWCDEIDREKNAHSDGSVVSSVEPKPSQKNWAALWIELKEPSMRPKVSSKNWVALWIGPTEPSVRPKVSSKNLGSFLE